MNLDNQNKMRILDDIFLGTKESQGLRNAVAAIKFVLFDDDSVLPDGLKYNDKYEFISSRRGGRAKAKTLSELDLTEDLCQYAMSSFGLCNTAFTVTYDDYKKALDNTITRDYTAAFAVELVAYAFTFEPYGAVAVLEKNKTLRKALASSLLNERYIENKMLMLDRFDGVILSTKMDEFTKEKFLDNYKSLANYFYNIKTRSYDYLNYLENN